MNDIRNRNDFSSLTSDQILGLVESIKDSFGSGIPRNIFASHLLALLEDVPGFETGDVPASLNDAAWAAYRGIEMSGGCK